MTEEKRSEGSRIIARFMGMKRHDHASYATWSNKKGEHIFESVLQYDSKYDWLMPVWIKFRDLKFKSKSDAHYHKQICAAFGNGILNSDIKEAFNDAVMAINWYNLHNPSTPTNDTENSGNAND